MHTLTRPQNMYNTYTMNKSLSTTHHHHPMITRHQQSSHFHTDAVAAVYAPLRRYDTSNCLFSDTTAKKSIMRENLNNFSCADAAAEVVVVNSIIYEKPSSSRIVVDIGTQITQALLKGDSDCQPWKSMNIHNKHPQKKRACMSDLEKLLSCEDQNKDAEWYVMSTTINGSIEHHIAGFCANFLDMILKESKDSEVDNDEDDANDEDSFIQFVSDNEDNNERDEVNEDEDEDSFIQFISDNENFTANYNSHSDCECDSEDERDEDDYMPKSFIDENCDEKYLIHHSDFTDNIDSVDGEVVYYQNFGHRLTPLQNSQISYCDKRKKVCFNNQPVVHVMYTWDYAYRAARKGHWEMYARDRARFQLRINRMADALSAILQKQHRQQIYEKRFIPFYQQQKQQQSDIISTIYSRALQNMTKYQNGKIVEHCEHHKITRLALNKRKRHRGRLKNPLVIFYYYIF